MVVLSDIYHKSYGYLEEGLIQQGDDSLNNWPGNGMVIVVNDNGASQGIYLDVQFNQTYRIRVLNAASLAYYNLAIASHNLTVIQAGATPTQPLILSSIDINVAERFDCLITTNQPQLSYRINVQSNYQVSYYPHYHMIMNTGHSKQPHRHH